jgi:hypothetical protein
VETVFVKTVIETGTIVILLKHKNPWIEDGRISDEYFMGNSKT